MRGASSGNEMSYYDCGRDCDCGCECCECCEYRCCREGEGMGRMGRLRRMWKGQMARRHRTCWRPPAACCPAAISALQRWPLVDSLLLPVAQKPADSKLPAPQWGEQLHRPLAHHRAPRRTVGAYWGRSV